MVIALLMSRALSRALLVKTFKIRNLLLYPLCAALFASTAALLLPATNIRSFRSGDRLILRACGKKIAMSAPQHLSKVKVIILPGNGVKSLLNSFSN
jgi:hypothetical protein